jgi:hypothetical protein
MPLTVPPAIAPTLLPEEALKDVGVEEAITADDVELGGNCVPVLTLL